MGVTRQDFCNYKHPLRRQKREADRNFDPPLLFLINDQSTQWLSHAVAAPCKGYRRDFSAG